MGLDPQSPEPVSPVPDPSGPLASAGWSPDAWIGELLLACDAVRAAGLLPAEMDSSPEVSTHDANDLAAHRLALARSCLDRLHRRWPWPGTSNAETSLDGPLAGLGLTLGRYTLINLIGAGGHGLVFLAEDPTLHRRVALKVPRPEWLASERHRKRFLREAQALARLDHPGIVPIHDFGESGSVCYLATAYVDGPSLAEWLAAPRGEPLTPRIAAALALSLADAVAHAHSRGVLHCDLKPGNVLVEQAADPTSLPVVRVSDFGLAKLLDEARDENRTETLPFGTPRYMAPGAGGLRSQPDRSVDRRLRAGCDPAHDLDRRGAGPAGRPPNQRGVNRPDVPDSLRQIVGRCLQREPEDRYSSAAELGDDLRRFLAGQTVKARALGAAGCGAAGTGLMPAIVLSSPPLALS